MVKVNTRACFHPILPEDNYPDITGQGQTLSVFVWDIQTGQTRTHPLRGVRCPGVLSLGRPSQAISKSSPSKISKVTALLQLLFGYW